MWCSHDPPCVAAGTARRALTRAYRGIRGVSTTRALGCDDDGGVPRLHMARAQVGAGQLWASKTVGVADGKANGLGGVRCRLHCDIP